MECTLRGPRQSEPDRFFSLSDLLDYALLFFHEPFTNSIRDRADLRVVSLRKILCT